MNDKYERKKLISETETSFRSMCNGIPRTELSVARDANADVYEVKKCIWILNVHSDSQKYLIR